MNQADEVERTGVSNWSAAGAAADGDPSQALAGRPAAGARRAAPSGGLTRAGPGVHPLAAVCARPARERSPALRILIEDRSSGEGFVVEAPLIWSVAFAGRR